MERPYVLLSCAMSIDGCIDDTSDSRLLLSDPADLDRVDEVRAGCDAILVGAGTIRADNPRLLVRSSARREERVARGAPADPVKVAISGRGDLDPNAAFFTAGTSAVSTAGTTGTARTTGTAGKAGTIVYVSSLAATKTRALLAGAAEVVDAGQPADLNRVLADLAARGVARLMVEGGGSIHTQFLTAGLADELQLMVAPFFVGDSRAPRFAADGNYPWTPQHPARLVEARQVGTGVLLRYALSERFGPA